jgi:type IV secretion system protein VirD4
MSPDHRTTAPLGALGDIRAHHLASSGGAYVGRRGDAWVFSGREHATLVLGPPRSGKTSSIVVPSIVACPGTVVSTSTKPDVAVTTAALRSSAGPCVLYDPSGTVPTIPGVAPLRWSPVSASHAWDDALLMATGMVEAARRTTGGAAEGGHWTERAGALLAPLLHAAALTGSDMATVVGWVDRRQAGAALDVLDAVGADVAADLLAGIAATDERERSGIWSTTSGVLRAYRSHGALASTAGSSDPVASLVHADATIYICAPARHQAALAPLVVGLLTEIRTAVYRRAAVWQTRHQPRMGPTSLPEVLFALDEVANIAPIPDLPSMVSEAGGQGLTVMACLQDLSQARRRWGAEADGFLSLFGSTVVLPGIGDVATLHALSALAGEVDVPTRSVTAPGTPERSLRAVAERLVLGPAATPRRLPATAPSITVTTTRRRRLPVDVLSRGRPGHALVVDGRSTMSWVTLTPWFAAAPWSVALAPDTAPARAHTGPSTLGPPDRTDRAPTPTPPGRHGPPRPPDLGLER